MNIQSKDRQESGPASRRLGVLGAQAGKLLDTREFDEPPARIAQKNPGSPIE
jgi:hypothetical protein